MYIIIYFIKDITSIVKDNIAFRLIQWYSINLMNSVSHFETKLQYN